jgi:hypothetical protein
MARSQTSICNLALGKIGASLIASVNDGSKNANTCKAFYDEVVDQVLRRAEWNCAMHRKTLARLSDAPDFGYTYQYTLPTNPWCLMALEINENRNYEFKVEGRRLLTDCDEVNLLYIKRITDPNEFDPLCVDAIATKLAFDVCYPIMQSSKQKAGLYDELEGIYIAAGQADNHEGTQEKDEESAYSWLGARV